MREGCSCGAWIRGRRRDVLQWRTTHHCPDRPDSDGTSASAGAMVEHAGARVYDGEVPIVTGFRPNP